MTASINNVTGIYSDFLNQSFSIPIYDFFHQTKSTDGNLKLYLISSLLNKEEIYFGILISCKLIKKTHFQETLSSLKVLEKEGEISAVFPDWDNPNKFFIKTILINEKIVTRAPFINLKSPVGKIKLPPLVPINALAYQASKQNGLLKITSHYDIIGERGFLLFYKNDILVYNRSGEIELTDELNISDEIRSRYLLFKAWGMRVMKDHMLNHPFLVAFKWIDKNMIIDMIGTIQDKKQLWQIPIFSLSDSHLNIFDIKKCQSYSVYVDKTLSYKHHIGSIFFEVMERCPVKRLICSHKKLISNVYWIDDREINIHCLYRLDEFESYAKGTNYDDN